MHSSVLWFFNNNEYGGCNYFSLPQTHTHTYYYSHACMIILVLVKHANAVFLSRYNNRVHIGGLSNRTQSVRKNKCSTSTPFCLMSGSGGYRPEVVIFVIIIIMFLRP